MKILWQYMFYVTVPPYHTPPDKITGSAPVPANLPTQLERIQFLLLEFKKVVSVNLSWLTRG